MSLSKSSQPKTKMTSQSTTVGLFKLPPEIRRSIWHYCFPIRMLGMSATREPVKLKGNITHPLATIESYKTNLSPPVVFQICFESRMEALKSYTLEFCRTEEQALEWGVSRQTLREFRCPSSSFQRWRRGVYIHETLDIICPVGRNSVYGYVATGLALRGVFGKTFAISIGVRKVWCERPEPQQAGYIWDFSKIEEIILYDENLLRRKKVPLILIS